MGHHAGITSKRVDLLATQVQFSLPHTHIVMSRIRISGTMMPSVLSWILVSLFALPSCALHFYMHGGTPKCFVEELPKDTLVVGHYTITQFEQHTNTFHPDDTLGLFITVEEVFDNNHRIVSQKGAGKGRFTFSAADSGEHRLLCTDQLA